ncbi:MAG: type IV secretory system conjugative DNA transfer family protein [Tenericutes bacterium]|nr:type IV secretory system conjugative DNA transfer family protein [Mycoplasmatota bacterium]
MKLKFRAEPKDLLIFAIFCIFLLFVIAWGVVNLSSFATTGKLFGFNFLPAFTPTYLPATLVFYILALGLAFFSVKSYFFETEKGFGVTTNKSDKGYSRWAKDKEIKAEEKIHMINTKDNNYEHAGITLISNENQLWVDDGEYHNLVIGSTGSGKTYAVILPLARTLIKKGESIIVTDPKGEIYENTYGMLKENDYNIILLNFRNPQNGNCWNPLTLPYKLYKENNQDKSIELLDDLALNILYEENNNNADPFWEKTSADYFSGLALGLFEDAKEEEININSISLMTTVGEEKFGASTYIKEYFNAKDPASPASVNASSTILAPNETKGSILSVFKQKIKLFASRENLSEMLSHSDFELADIGLKKTAVFIIIQDEKKTYHSLATILVKQCYETLIDVAQDNGGKLPIRTNFLLDEFANMPPLKDVTTMITAARSRSIRFTLIIQNFAQLNQVYGKDNAETIKGNCGNLVYLISSELAALEEISKMCGEVKSKEKDKTASTPLVTVSDLQRMKMWEVIIIRSRLQPFKTKFTPDFKINWGKKYEKGNYPVRNKQAISLFDLKGFVKKQKQEKLSSMMENVGSNDDMVYNPFLTNNNPPQNTFIPPYISNSNEDEKTNNINIEDLVKKIDARIAELEEEERREQNQTVKKDIDPFKDFQDDNIVIQNDININNISKPDEGVLQTKDLEEEMPLPSEESVNEKPIEIKPIETIDNDDFFDDFFDN